MLTITEKAARKIKDLLQERDLDPQKHGLRIGVAGGGCSGFQYMMDLGEKKEEDNTYSREEALVFIDPKSALLVGGSVLDYNDGLTGAGFVVTNPQATGTCGCGMSFSV